MSYYFLLWLTLFGGYSLAAYAENETLLGVIEEPQCKDGGDTYVRAMFGKINDEWLSLDSAKTYTEHAPKNITWVISLDGKKLGDVTTDDPGFSSSYEWTYPRDHLLNIAPSEKIPSITNQNQNFGGWCAAPKNRPIPVVAHGGISDPDNWKPFTPSQKQVIQMFPQFKAQNGKAFVCPNPNSDSGVHFNYKANDIRALKSYRNKMGHLLISLALKHRKDMCGGLDEGWDTQTFLVNDQTSYIGANFTLVDAGDYDANGTSELLFWLSSYNKDGYILFSPNNSVTTEYSWSYH